MKKVGIIGVIGDGARFATGQAVKCRTILGWFEKEYGSDQVLFANIDSAKKHPVRVLRNMLRALRECTNIVFMPGQNIEVFAPVLHLLNLFYRRKVQYIVTGGDLAEVLKKKPFLKKSIASFQGTHVQAKKLRDELKEMGIRRARYLPNCRDYVPAVPFDHWKAEPLRVCTYSRVIKEKGILDAIEICRKANETLGRRVFVLAVYGKLYDHFAADQAQQGQCDVGHDQSKLPYASFGKQHAIVADQRHDKLKKRKRASDKHAPCAPHPRLVQAVCQRHGKRVHRQRRAKQRAGQNKIKHSYETPFQYPGRSTLQKPRQTAR